LSEAANELESVVVGYGTLSKKKLTGNIARVTSHIEQIWLLMFKMPW
jgi:hypothetical protein